MNLFRHTLSPVVYIIDTSALITLDLIFKKEKPVFVAIWEEIEELIKYDSFKTLDFVEEEINRYKGDEDFLKEWIKHWKKHLVVETDVNVLGVARQIINEEYDTGFLNPTKQAQGIEEADPYLIAYGKVYGGTLITSESKEKPNKIPAVCRKHSVRCIDINDFLEEREMKMERKSFQ